MTFYLCTEKVTFSSWRPSNPHGTPFPHRQNGWEKETNENITFPQLNWRADITENKRFSSLCQRSEISINKYAFQYSGGSKRGGGTPGAHPTMDQNFLNFMQFFGKTWQICMLGCAPPASVTASRCQFLGVLSRGRFSVLDIDINNSCIPLVTQRDCVSYIPLGTTV